MPARQPALREESMKLPLSKIEEFLGATGECELKEVALGYSIDSRTIQPGELFFAVKGERFDGHDFVHQALERGAVSAVVRKDQLARFPVKSCLLAVDDTLTALQTWPRPAACGKPVAAPPAPPAKPYHEPSLCAGHPISRLKSEGNFNNHFVSLDVAAAARIPSGRHRW
jgi:UDP-N-acetylmuramoyl-tripeptide--D-alanyl-D-alanine ligase